MALETCPLRIGKIAGITRTHPSVYHMKVSRNWVETVQKSGSTQLQNTVSDSMEKQALFLGRNT